MKRKFTYTLSALTLLALSLTACGGNDNNGDEILPDGQLEATPEKTINLAASQVKEASSNLYFSPQLTVTKGNASHFVSAKSSAVLESGQQANLFAYEVKSGSTFGVTVIDENGKDRTSIVGDDGTITAPEVDENLNLQVYLFALNGDSTVRKALDLTITPANGTAVNNYYDNSSLGDAERTKMAAATEKYLINNGLAPITFMDSGGYQLYSKRLHSPFLDSNKYIAGYGFGITDYGSIDAPLEAEKTEAYKMFLHEQVDASMDIGEFNYLKSNSNAVATFYEYISQYYFRTLVNKDSTGYEYTNGLSRKNAPEAINPDANGASDTWKVYLRVGGSTADNNKGVTPGLNYRTASTKLSQFDNRPIALEDYLTPLKVLATQSINYFRGSEQAAEATPNRQLKGFAEFFESSGDATSLPSNEEFMKKVGVKIDETDNSITFQFNGKITPDYAEYQLNGVWANPFPEEFLKALGNGDVIKGAKTMGASSDGLTPLDTMLCVGPYYTSAYQSKKTVAFAKNETWPLAKDDHGRDLYQIKGYHLNINTALATDENTTIKMFEQGLTDSSDIPADYWDKYASSPLKKAVPGSGYFPVYFVNTFDKHSHDSMFPGSEWEVKPILSNNNFYKGLVVGVDRNAIANYYHRNPAYGIQEPVNKVSPKSPTAYNDSDAHKEVISETFGTSLDDFTLWKDNAADYFELAIQEELDAGHYTLGTESNPTVIKLELVSLDDATRKYTDGVIFSNWEEAFDLAVKSHINENNETNWVSNGKPLIKLDVTAKVLSSSLSDTQIQTEILNQGVKAGNYDGQTVFRVSGNGLDVFNNFDKYKSDDSSGFTLNFGGDTGVINKDLSYNGKLWSFNSLWGAGNGGVFVDEYGAEKQFIVADESKAKFAGSLTEKVKVTFPLSIDEAAKNVKIFGDAIDLETGKEAYVEIPFTKNSDGTYTLEFSGNTLIPGAVLGPDYAAYTYLDFMITFDVDANGETISKNYGSYWLITPEDLSN